MNAIEIRGLIRSFRERIAVDHLDLTIRQGECFALLGQNGAGKTTTIKMLSGLLLPDAGDAHLMGHSILTDVNEVKRIINVSPQETAVAPLLTVRENLEFIAGVYGLDRKAAAVRAGEMMEKFNLSARAKDRGKTLSGGMQRRLSIAMALISEPSILFLDEPTLGLDVRARRDLWRVIDGLKGTITIVLTTHYLEEAEVLCDRIAILHGGHLQALGTAEELKAFTGKDSFEDAFLSLTEGEVE